MIRFRYFSKDYAKEQTSGQPEKETVHFTFSKPVFLDSSAPLLSLLSISKLRDRTVISQYSFPVISTLFDSRKLDTWIILRFYLSFLK